MCLPVAGIDATFMKNNEYNGQMLLLVMRDGALRNVVVAAALVDKETEANYTWFFQQVKHGEGMSDLLNNSKMLFISDRNQGLMNAIDSHFPDASRRHCLAHLARNIKDRPGGSTGLGPGQGLFWSLARSTNVTEWNANWQLLQTARPDLAAYLAEADFYKWSLLHLMEKGVTGFGVDTSNFVESSNAAFRGLRELQPPAWLETISTYLATERYERRAEAETWREESHIITPPVMDRYWKQAKMASAYKVERLGVDLAKVEHNGTDRFAHQRQVRLDVQQCTCTDWEQLGYPCRHAVAFAKLAGGGDRLSSAEWFRDSRVFSPTFLVDTVIEAYCIEVVLPLRDDVVPPEGAALLPPLRVKPAGRPRKKRIRSRGEGGGDGAAKRVFHCGRCRNTGHTARTCTNPVGG
ncbi:unnamed protein product [Phaeothamnion confervicola]